MVYKKAITTTKAAMTGQTRAGAGEGGGGGVGEGLEVAAVGTAGAVTRHRTATPVCPVIDTIDTLPILNPLNPRLTPSGYPFPSTSLGQGRKF